MMSSTDFLRRFDDMYEDMVASGAGSDSALVTIAATVRVLLEQQTRILSILENVPQEQLVLANMARLRKLESEEFMSIVDYSQQARKDIAEFRSINRKGR